jgi:thiol:disulfide interchange protein
MIIDRSNNRKTESQKCFGNCSKWHCQECNPPSTQASDLTTNSSTETSPQATVPGESPESKPEPATESSAEETSSESQALSKSQALANSSPETAKLLLGGAIIFLFLLGIIMLIKRKRS